jgi:hypothetical protein
VQREQAPRVRHKGWRQGGAGMEVEALDGQTQQGACARRVSHRGQYTATMDAECAGDKREP